LQFSGPLLSTPVFGGLSVAGLTAIGAGVGAGLSLAGNWYNVYQTNRAIKRAEELQNQQIDF